MRVCERRYSYLFLVPGLLQPSLLRGIHPDRFLSVLYKFGVCWVRFKVLANTLCVWWWVMLMCVSVCAGAHTVGDLPQPQAFSSFCPSIRTGT